MQNDIFVFDIETIPDVNTGRKLYNLQNLSDKEVGQAMLQIRRQQTEGSDFVRIHLHQIVAISVVLRRRDQTIKVWSLGEEESSEAELIERFFKGLEKYTPTLVSWNGSGFDLPVLHYRALFHGIAAPRYWENGEHDSNFKWNNYLSRYHTRHTDLMDVLSGFQGRAAAPLDEIAVLLGLPGKMGMSGHKVWDAYQAGDIAGIRNYCETDVLNTYLIYLRYLLISGRCSKEEYEAEILCVKTMLQTAPQAHLTEFLEKWG
jgi:predicted PolB exonuclease-like 3'-5' exonuclease